VSTVFFGGGTPSLFSPAALAGLIEKTAELFGLKADAEITMEANPGSLEGAARSKLAEFRGAGINRLSIGGQSFHDSHLKTLGRIHSAAETEQALHAAHAAGFDSISCDLIFAVPDQTLEEWHSDLEHLIALKPNHISAYNLTYEPGTPMTGLRDVGRVHPADEDLELAMFESTINILADAGFEQYEISNYAREGHQCRHNLAYWRWRDYLGLGAGAHGFFKHPSGSQDDAGNQTAATRYANHRIPEIYMGAHEGKWASSNERIDKTQAIAEFLLVHLRVIQGFARSEFRRLFDEEVEDAVPELTPMQDAGMIEATDERVRLSRRGLRLADAVIMKLAAS